MEWLRLLPCLHVQTDTKKISATSIFFEVRPQRVMHEQGRTGLPPWWLASMRTTADRAAVCPRKGTHEWHGNAELSVQSTGILEANDDVDYAIEPAHKCNNMTWLGTLAWP